MKENELKAKFVEFIISKGFRVLSEFSNLPPDLIISDDKGKTIAVEIKGDKTRSAGRRFPFATAFGQLFFSKMKQNADDLWLILPKIPSISSLDWFRLFKTHEIKVLTHSKNTFVEVSEDNLGPPSLKEISIPIDEKFRENLPPEKRRFWHTILRSLQTDIRIFNLLKNHPEGLTIGEISNILDMHREVVDSHVRNPDRGLSGGFSHLKNKIFVENKKVKLIEISNIPSFQPKESRKGV